MGVDWLLGMLPSWDWLDEKLQRYRHPHRIEIKPAWRPPPIWSPSDPTMTFWRILSVEIVAGKAKDLLVAAGEVEARADSGDDWIAVAPLDRFLSLPVELKAGRAEKGRLEGSSVAKAVEKVLDLDGKGVELRLQARDRHDTTLASNVLETTLEDLRDERIKYV